MDNRRITVLHITGIMNAGGAESLIMDILRNQTESVENILCLNYSGKQPEQGVFDEEIRDLGIKIYYMPSLGSSGMIKYISSFRKMIRGLGDVDIVHSHLNAVGGVIALAARMSKVKNIIVHSHANINYRVSGIKKMLSEINLFFLKILILLFANNFWACSDSAAKRLFFSNKKAVVIKNAIDVRKYLAERKEGGRRESDNTITIGAIGRVARIKNYEFIIDVVRVLRERQIACQFICYGRHEDAEYYNELTKKVNTLGLNDCVDFAGNTTNAAQRLSSFDVFVMPSFTEGFGIAALEAQAAGIPAIVSAGVPQEVDVGLGLVCFLDEFDSELWADKIIEIKSRVPVLTREEVIKAFEDKGYDAMSNVKIIEEKYREIVRG